MVRLSLSSACLDATTIPHASGAWCRIFHLMQVCCLPWCLGRPVLCVLRAWLLGVCVGLALLRALPPGLPVPLWTGAVGLCSALWAGLVRGPCLWASYKPLLYGPILRPCISGLIWASEKVLYSRLVLRLCISGLFSWLCFRLKISGQIFRASRAGFFLRIFRVDFSGENFPDIFPGFIFRVFSWTDFRGGIWLPLFSRCNIHTIPGSP